jgi:hypothetical protein
MYPSKIRLSYSTLEGLLNLCERKFQMVKLLRGYDDKEDSVNFSWGHGWGAGVVHYLLTGNLDDAIYHAWQAYWPIIETDKKSQVILVNALRVARTKMDNYREEFEIAFFNGKPAIELSFRLDINETFYYVGYIDGVFLHKRDRYYAVLENKHTAAWITDINPMYQNSGQGLSYSIVLDKIAAQPLAEYSLHHFVAQLKNSYDPIIHTLRYKKNLLDRLKWFTTLGIDVDRITQMMKLNFFPMRGSSCLKWNRPCNFFGMCGLQVNDRPKTDEDVKEDVEYQFVYTLDEIVKDHLARVYGESTQ